MASHGSRILDPPGRAWTTRELILAEFVTRGLAVRNLSPSARFIAVVKLASNYRPRARAFGTLDAALRWMQQNESQQAVPDVIVDLGAPSVDNAVIRPFHVLTCDDARESLSQLDLDATAGGNVHPISSARERAADRVLK